VYAKRPFGGPEHVLHYLARYTHRVAISNHRLLSVADGQVSFRWKDYAHGGKQRKMTVTAEEFLRRFMMHVLPHRFVRIRFSGFLANRRRKQLLALCLQLLGSNPPHRPEIAGGNRTKPTTTWLCPHCGGPMVLIQKLTTEQISRRSVSGKFLVDSS
jgi:Putative transposase